MYNESYDTYIRSILGYQNQNDIFSSPSYENDYSQFSSETRNLEVEELYPDIYKKVYPMVVKACRANTMPVNDNVLNKMTDEIIISLENMESINLNINLRNDVKTSSSKTENNRVDSKISSHDKTKESEENRSPRIPNRGLRDIIRILLLRELFGNPGWRPPMRPPYRPPMRPPFPGPGPHPPIRPREYDNDIYQF